MPIDDPAPAIEGSKAQVGHRDIEKVDFSTIAPEPSLHFTGAADLRRITGGLELARLAHVPFQDGAQTHWHHHTGPQWLVFLKGLRRSQHAVRQTPVLRQGRRRSD